MDKPDIFDLGLQADVQMFNHSPLNRRRFLQMGAATMALLLAGCQTDTDSDASETSSTDTASGDVCVAEIPSETAGPFPADGSQASNQTLNALALAGIVRPDIRNSLGTGNVAEGLLCDLEMTLVNVNDGCMPLANHAIYVWHCDRDGNYSMYSPNAVNEDYLRGVQVTDSSGKVTFTSIFPACYPGRWPHVHFEVYESLDQTSSPRNVLLTSQLAFPEDACDAVYALDGYAQSVQSLARLSLATDGVFRDGVDLQMATMSGDTSSGYTAHLTVGIAV